MEKEKRKHPEPKQDQALKWPGFGRGELVSPVMCGRNGQPDSLPQGQGNRLEFIVLGMPHDGAKPKEMMNDPFNDSATVGYIWPVAHQMNRQLPPKTFGNGEKWPRFMPEHSWQ